MTFNTTNDTDQTISSESCTSLQEMPRRSHNGQDFQYKVLWRKAGGKTERWNHGYAKFPPFSVNNTGTYVPFEIKVQAVNALGEGPAPEAEIGHSGEDGI